MLQKVEPISITDFNKGLYTDLNILNNEKGQSPNCMNVKWNADGSIQKRLGSSTQNTVQIGSTSLAGWILDAGGTLSTSLQAYWKLNETSGSRGDEFSTHNLTDFNSTGFNPSGIRGNAANFVAANSNALIHLNTSTLATGANSVFHLAAWIYLNSTSTTIERTIISKRDVADSFTVLLLHADGTDASTTFTDSSASGKTVTANGDAQVDTAQFKFGGASALFDGSGDYLSVADSEDWNLGTGDFAIDFQLRYNAAVSSDQISFELGNSGTDGIRINQRASAASAEVRINGTTYSFTLASDFAADTWYHIALTRSGNNLRFFRDGVQQGSTQTSNENITGGTDGVFIGANNGASLPFTGWMDEIRVSKGNGRWTANFTAPTTAYAQEFEYFLYVGTDNIITFRVSSSGIAANGTVRATSHGAVTTSTWYNVQAFHQLAGNTAIGVIVNLSETTASYTSGVRSGSGAFTIGGFSNGAVGYFDGRIDEVGFWKKKLAAQEISDIYGGGTGNTFSKGSSSFSWAMYDFGASAIRWLTVAAGTGIYASSNMGVTFVEVATTRTQNYQYFERSKNVLIATSDSYDVPLYWAGSVGTFFIALAINSAPAVKYAINHQGFLILLNSSTRKRGFYYQDDNTQLTSAWPNNFDLPSTADDEITVPFTLGKTLYVSTKYRIFRVSYVGGNPDWSYQAVRDWGYVPRTVRKISLKGGELIIGMDWNRRVRVLDGVDDEIISTSIEENNGMCDFATEKISYAGSGLIVSHAEVDPLEHEYRLNVAIGADSTQTTHAIILNGRSLAFYPYSNQGYQCMCIAESAGRQFLVAADRSGRIYILNTGYQDVMTPIDDVYDSPFMFRETPAVASKSHKIDLYFRKDSAGTIYFQDRADLSNIFTNTKTFEIKENESVVAIVKSIDLPATQNIYQFKLTSSMGTAEPWTLNHVDYLQSLMGFGVPNS